MNKIEGHILVLMQGNSTNSKLIWYSGDFDLAMLTDANKELIETDDFYLKEMKAQGYKDGESVIVLVEFRKIDKETQYGTGEGSVNTLPAYYDVIPKRIIEDFRVRGRTMS